MYLRDKLKNKGVKYVYFVGDVGCVVLNTGYKSKKIYMVNYKCFERICMKSGGENAEEVREYFSKIREFIHQNHTLIYQALNNFDGLKKLTGSNAIYVVLKVDR